MRKSLHILCLPLLFALLAIGCSGSSEGGGDSDYNFDTGGLPSTDTSTAVDADGSADTATAPDTASWTATLAPVSPFRRAARRTSTVRHASSTPPKPATCWTPPRPTT